MGLLAVGASGFDMPPRNGGISVVLSGTSDEQFATASSQSPSVIVTPSKDTNSVCAPAAICPVGAGQVGAASARGAASCDGISLPPPQAVISASTRCARFMRSR